MKRHQAPVILFITISLLMTGCASAPVAGRKAVDTTIDLSGRWNNADSRMVSEEMIKDCLSRPWLQRFKIMHGGEIPSVIVGRIKNRRHEQINVQTFIKDLERALINSGQIQFVESKGERLGIPGERKPMAKHASDETMKGPGKETCADFMLIGDINTIKDDIGKKDVIFYQINLELIHLASYRKYWIGEKKIKKLIKEKNVKG